jgi:hypothetical protein
MPRTAIGAFYAMMRASYWKRASRNSASTRPAVTDDARHFPRMPTRSVAWFESGTFETCPTILRMSVHRVDWKSQWSGQTDANDAVDGAHSAASKCHRVVALKQTTLRGAVHGRG